MERIEQIYDKIILAQIGFTIGRMSEFEVHRARREPGFTLDLQWATGHELDLIARHVLSLADYAYWKYWVDNEGRLPADG
jgi:hypothetical protein